MEVIKTNKYEKVIPAVIGNFALQEIIQSCHAFFRAAISLEMIFVHGFKKLGVGVSEAEIVPNPLHLPEAFNNAFATSANILFPFFVLIGFCTRIAALFPLAVTLTGYFILHWNDAPLIKDTPYIYSVAYLLILMLGPGDYSIDKLISRNRQTL